MGRIIGRASLSKKKRHDMLQSRVQKDVFLTDEELAEIFEVSVPTIRLDRLELGIPELRKRIKNIAQQNCSKVKSIKGQEMLGELIEVVLGDKGTSMLETNDSMAFQETKIIQGRYVYALSESLAIAVIDAYVALVGVANIKYTTPCYAGSKLFAKAEVKKRKGNKYIVWVDVFEKQIKIFEGKFILVSLEKSPDKKI